MITIRLRIPFTNKVLSFNTADDKTVREWLGGGSNSGVDVNEHSAMRVTAYLAAVKIISETVATLPLHLFREKDGQTTKAHHNSLYEVLHYQANSEMTAYTFRELFQSHICNWGNGYAYIDRNGAGQVTALWPLLPDRTRPDRDAKGNLFYWTTLPSGESRKLDPFDVFHVPGLGFDGILGYNPVFLAKEALGLSVASEEFGAKFFANGATPSGVIEYPGKLSDAAYERYKSDVRGAYQGLSRSHKLMILEEGLKYHQVTIPPDAAQFLETRKFQIAEIARIFRVPLHMLQELDRSTNNNIEHQSLEFVMHTLMPWLVRWEQTIRMKLLSERERKQGYYAKHNVEGLLRGDIKARYEAYQIALGNGILSPNEVRRKEDINPYEGGDSYRVPLNMARVLEDGSLESQGKEGEGEQTTE